MGNFTEILHLIAKYISPTMQNELLQIMANMLREEINAEVKEEKWFSIMADESRDNRKSEQLSVVVRYVYHDSIHEEFWDS